MTANNVKKYLLITLGIVASGIVVYFILPVSLPIVLAILTALFLSPAVKGITGRTKLPRNLAVFIVFTGFLTVVIFISYFILTRALIQLNQFVENLPMIINDINIAWIALLDNLRLQFDPYSQDIVDNIDQVVTYQLLEIRNTLQGINIIRYVTDILLKVPSYIVSFLVYLIALYLFLLDLPGLKSKLFSYMKKETADKVSFMSSRMSYIIFGFFKAQFLVGIFTFIVTFTALMFIAPEVALIMSLLIWIIDFIPIIGSVAVLAPWAGYHMIAGSTVTAVYLFILAAALLTIRRTVEPKVMGDRIGLSPLATLISLYLGLMILGPVGLILGPVTVILISSAKEAGIIKMNFKV